MSIWITTGIALFGVLSSLILQFYFKWVPDVADQKRHLKRAAMWALDLMTVAPPVWWLYATAHSKGTVTPQLVVSVSMNAAALCFCVILICFRRSVLEGILRRHFNSFTHLLDNTDKSLAITSRHLDATQRHQDALFTLSKDPNLSTETVRVLCAILDSRRTEVPHELST